MIPDYPTQQLSCQLRSLWKTAFGDDDVFLDHFFSTGFSRDRCRCVVNEEGKLMSALYWLDAEYEGNTFAYLYAIATDPQFRRRGILKYLLADTYTVLKNRGYAGAMLLPGDEDLRKMYASMGFQNCTTINTLISASQPVTVLIHPVDREEYGKLRLKYLPINGAIQAGPSLAFLETQCKFYSGTGFVMCARPKSPEVQEALEFLGDTEVIPGVLCALGYAMGTFRTPGDALPFAMGFPIQKDVPFPGYLGFAFD